MGSFDFSQPDLASFNFNTSSLTYYIILPKEEGDFKSLIKEYMGLSSKIEMPPDSGFGPTFWSDDFTQDFHGNVTNAQENYFDVINHLTEYHIRATDMFADRKSSCSWILCVEVGGGIREIDANGNRPIWDGKYVFWKLRL